MSKHYEQALRENARDMAQIIKELLVILRENTEWTGTPERRAKQILRELEAARELDSTPKKTPKGDPR